MDVIAGGSGATVPVFRKRMPEENAKGHMADESRRLEGGTEKALTAGRFRRGEIVLATLGRWRIIKKRGKMEVEGEQKGRNEKRLQTSGVVSVLSGGWAGYEKVLFLGDAEAEAGRGLS